MRRSALFVALALAVVSCGGGGSSDEGPAPTDAAPTPAETAPEGSYQTLREMQLDVEAAFVLCNAPMKVYDPPLVEAALAHGDCTTNVSLLLFEPSNVQAGVTELQADPEGPPDLVVGDNWIIACTSGRSDCADIQGITGGELIAAP